MWAYGSYVAGRLLVLLSTAILARLLDPDDFGLVALALVFTSLLDVMSDLGVTQALVIVDDEHVRERADTVFLFSLGVGTFFALASAAIAPLAAMFFHQPALIGIMPVLGANFVVRALGMTHFALAQKWIDFRSRTAGEIANVVVRGVAGVALALLGFGAWSLVLGYLVGTMAMNVALWVMVDWRPSFRMRREHLRALIRFGGQLTGVDVLTAIMANADYFFIGRVLGAADLGLYTLGFRLPELLVINLSVVASQVLFPAFAALDGEARGRGYLLSLRYVLMVGLPLTAGLVILARPTVLAIFGGQWEGSIEPMQVLGVYALAVTVGIPAGTAYKASGRADVLLKLAVPRGLLAVASIWVFVDHGIAAVAACQAAVAGLFAAIGIALAARLLSVGLRQIVRTAWPPVAATLGMAIGLLAVERTVTSPWPALLVGGAVGATLYLGLLWLLAPDAIRHLFRTAFPSRPPRGAPAPAAASAGG
jgi:O-antigen/teichoic acid export membrane protein